MASLTQWTWVWVDSGSRWTGRPGMLQSMGSQRVGHDWATELNWLPLGVFFLLLLSLLPFLVCWFVCMMCVILCVHLRDLIFLPTFSSVIQITFFLLTCLQVCWFFCQLIFTAEPLQWIVNLGFAFYYLVLFNIYIYILPFYWSLFTETLSPYPYFCKHNFISLSSHHSLNSSSSEVSLSTQFTLWASSEADLVDFFRLWMGHSFPFSFFMSHNFWLKTEHFRYYPVAALDTDSPQPPPQGTIVLFACLSAWWLGFGCFDLE